MDMVFQGREAFVSRQRHPLIFDLAPKNLDPVQFWRIRREINDMHTLIQPVQPLALEMSRAIDTDIVQHHDGKGIRRLLGNQAKALITASVVMVAIVEW